MGNQASGGADRLACVALSHVIQCEFGVPCPQWSCAEGVGKWLEGARVALNIFVPWSFTRGLLPVVSYPCYLPSLNLGRRNELLAMRRELSEAASQHTSQNKRMIARKDFDAAMATLHIEESDQEVYDRLFTLFDKTGAGKVDHLEVRGWGGVGGGAKRQVGGSECSELYRIRSVSYSSLCKLIPLLVASLLTDFGWTRTPHTRNP